MKRKLVTVQEITTIDPIKNADRIVLAHVLGWKVIISKDMGLHEGSKVAYFETDSLLPNTDARYTAFQPRGTKKMIIEPEDDATSEPTVIEGHVLRTMKMRGVYSQGLIMTLPELGVPDETPIGTDITEACGVVKYEPPMFGNGAKPMTEAEKAAMREQQGIIGPFNAPCAKSDAPRVQILTGIWDELKELPATPTVKVDGASTTLYRDPMGDVHVYSRNYEIKRDSLNGKTAEEFGLIDLLNDESSVDIIQFELAGPGIQGNRQKLKKVRPFVFAAWKDGRKLARAEWPEALTEFAAPVLDATEWALTGTMDSMIDKVDGLRGNITNGVLDEGVVWHFNVLPDEVSDEVLEALDDNLCVKIINNKYLARNEL